MYLFQNAIKWTFPVQDNKIPLNIYRFPTIIKPLHLCVFNAACIYYCFQESVEECENIVVNVFNY